MQHARIERVSAFCVLNDQASERVVAFFLNTGEAGVFLSACLRYACGSLTPLHASSVVDHSRDRGKGECRIGLT